MINNFRDMVQQSVLARGLATIFLFLVLLIALFISAYDLLIGRDVPAMVYTVLSGGVVACATLIGINLGIILQPAPPPVAPPVAPAPGGTNGTVNQ
jgi:polyferredoxin